MNNINRKINNGETLGGILTNAKIPFRWSDINNLKIKTNDKISFDFSSGNLKLNGKIVYNYKRKIIQKISSIDRKNILNSKNFEEKEYSGVIYRTFDTFTNLKKTILDGTLADVKRKNGKLIPIIYRYKKSTYYNDKLKNYNNQGYKNTTSKNIKKRYSIYSDNDGFKRVVPGTYGDKKILAVHGSAGDNNSTIIQGAKNNLYAYTLLRDIKYNGKNRNYIIENFNPKRGEGALGSITKFKNAGIKYKLNQESIAVELALPTNGKRKMGTTNREVDKVLEPTKGQYVVLKLLHSYLNKKMNKKLYLIPSDATTFNDNGKIIDNAHGDTIEVSKIGGKSMSEIQDYINENYRIEKLTNNAIDYFKNKYTHYS